MKAARAPLRSESARSGANDSRVSVSSSRIAASLRCWTATVWLLRFAWVCNAKTIAQAEAARATGSTSVAIHNRFCRNRRVTIPSTIGLFRPRPQGLDRWKSLTRG